MALSDQDCVLPGPKVCPFWPAADVHGRSGVVDRDRHARGGRVTVVVEGGRGHGDGAVAARAGVVGHAVGRRRVRSPHLNASYRELNRADSGLRVRGGGAESDAAALEPGARAGERGRGCCEVVEVGIYSLACRLQTTGSAVPLRRALSRRPRSNDRAPVVLSSDLARAPMQRRRRLVRLRIRTASRRTESVPLQSIPLTADSRHSWSPIRASTLSGQFRAPARSLPKAGSTGPLRFPGRPRAVRTAGRTTRTDSDLVLAPFPPRVEARPAASIRQGPCAPNGLPIPPLDSHRYIAIVFRQAADGG